MQNLNLLTCYSGGTGCGTFASKGKRIMLEEELAQPPKEELQPLRNFIEKNTTVSFLEKDPLSPYVIFPKKT